MRYVNVSWDHDFAEDHVLYISELGDDSYETRKVQIYRDGRSEWADPNHETATAGLAEISFPPVKEISSQPMFRAQAITAGEFNRAWDKAREIPGNIPREE